MRVYIASPYSLGDSVRNVRKSLDVAGRIVELGHTPFVPLLSHFWHFHSPKPYETWMRMDLEWVKTCDALLRLPGESKGADAEVEQARKACIPVFFTMKNLEGFLDEGVWLAAWKVEKLKELLIKFSVTVAEYKKCARPREWFRRQQRQKRYPRWSKY